MPCLPPIGLQMALLKMAGAGGLFRRWLFYLPRVSLAS